MGINRYFPSSLFGRIISLSLILGFIIIFALLVFPGKPPITGSIKKQVTSTIIVPTGKVYSLDRGSVKYDDSKKLLTYIIRRSNQAIGTVTEQPTPDTFIDIPDFGTKFFQQAGQYKTFDSALGTVHLLHVVKSKKDAAALNAKGTLMFVSPSINLSEDDWRKLFQNLTTQL